MVGGGGQEGKSADCFGDVVIIQERSDGGWDCGSSKGTVRRGQI